MPANDRRKLLQLIIDDPASSEQERTEAKLALGEMSTDQSTPPSRRLGRNGNVAQTQMDVDADLEQALTFRPNDGLTTQDRIEIERGLPESTRAILNAIGDNTLLWLFGNNVADVPVLIECVNRTGSRVVKEKAIQALQLIATHSTIESAKMQAQQYLSENEPQDSTRKE
jgi:hypothetical protein